MVRSPVCTVTQKLGGRVEGSRRSPTVGFLAVYREGFETVLFYAALFTTSGSCNSSGLQRLAFTRGCVIHRKFIQSFMLSRNF